MDRVYIDVAVKGPFSNCFTYYADKRYKECLFPGQILSVEFGKRTLTGYLHRIQDDSCNNEMELLGCKEISDIVNIRKSTCSAITELVDFIHRYYYAPLGYAYSFAVPNFERIKHIAACAGKTDNALKLKNLNKTEKAVMGYILGKNKVTIPGIKKKFSNLQRINLLLSYLHQKGFIDIIFDEADKYPSEQINADFKLNDIQNNVYNTISSSVYRGFSTHLLYGITGSGKTYVYLKLIQDIISAGSQVLLLVPEIGLSIELERRFREFISSAVMLHSAVSRKNRRYILQGIKEGSHKLVIGPRSALFISFKKLGLIIIDEEHDKSYKQDSIPYYNARDIAIYRAKTENIPIILGSATPSLESYYNAMHKHKYQFHVLPDRYGDAQLPEVQVVDLKEEKEQKRSVIISSLLQDSILKMHEEGDQGIVFINRRGFYSAIVCLKCGDSIRCRRCSVSMSYHSDRERLICHQCGYSREMVEKCPYCGSAKQTHFGFGTEHVEELIKAHIPEIRILRFDSDNVKQSNKDKLLGDFADHKYDLMVGTQMITKGFDFPRVNLVGVIQADENLYMPDFRGAERTFQIINQVSGRSGRRGKMGTVILQTYMPEHYSVVYAVKNDYTGFAEKELNIRKRFAYPPFKRLCMISSIGYNKSRVLDLISRLNEILIRERDPAITIIGPVSAFIEKRKNMFRWNILLQGSIEGIAKSLSRIQDLYKRNLSAITIDMDPYTF